MVWAPGRVNANKAHEERKKPFQNFIMSEVLRYVWVAIVRFRH